MPHDSATLETRELTRGGEGEDALIPLPALAIAWSSAEPARLGEVFLFPEENLRYVLGRGVGVPSDAAPRALAHRQLPGLTQPTPALGNPGLSREQLRIVRHADQLVVKRVGRCALTINGAPSEGGPVRVGDVLTLHKQLVLVCVSRPQVLPEPAHLKGPYPGLGQADAHALVGESARVYKLRDSIRFAATSQQHAAVIGPSGSGKKLVAIAIHDASHRGHEAPVLRDVVSLLDAAEAELFGNVADYPQPGLAGRRGLLSEADGTTLVLRGIDELEPQLQRKLARVIADGGAHQRLGEADIQHPDVRLLVTARDWAKVEPDLVQQLRVQVQVPGLDERREDIPLLARDLVLRICVDNEAFGSRFVEGWDGHEGQPRFSRALIEQLTRHEYIHHVRELQGLLWRALGESGTQVLDALPELRTTEVVSSPTAASAPPTREQVLAVLQQVGGNQAHAWKQLGLSSRYALYRLLKKYDIRPGSDSASNAD